MPETKCTACDGLGFVFRMSNRSDDRPSLNEADSERADQEKEVLYRVPCEACGGGGLSVGSTR